MTDAEERISRHLSEGAATVPADEEVYRRLREEAEARSRRHRWIIGAGALGSAAAIVLAVLVVRDDESENLEVVAPAITSTSFPPSVTSITVPPPSRFDWDGVRYDFGTAKRLHRVNGTWLVVFDRVQVETDKGLKSAPDFTEEPVHCCHTDVITQNDNPALRTYRVSAGAEVLVLVNKDDVCPGPEENGNPPRWEPRTIEEVSGYDPYTRTEVSLTFDDTGGVTRLRVTPPC